MDVGRRTELDPDATLPVASFRSPTGSPPLVAAGSNGLVVATSGLDAQLATSPDGLHWVVQPRDALPAGFALVDLHSSANGYVAIGWMKKAPGEACGFALVGRRAHVAEDAHRHAEPSVRLRARRRTRP